MTPAARGSSRADEPERQPEPVRRDAVRRRRARHGWRPRPRPRPAPARPRRGSRTAPSGPGRHAPAAPAAARRSRRPGARARAAARRSRRCRRTARCRRSPTCSAIIVPWLKPTSTVRSGRRLRRHLVEPVVERREGRLRLPARHRLRRAVEPGDRKPLVAHRVVDAALAARSAPGTGCSAGAAPAARRARSGRCRRRRSRAGTRRGCRRSRRRRAARARSGWSSAVTLAHGVPRVLGTIAAARKPPGSDAEGPRVTGLVHTFETLLAHYGIAALFVTITLETLGAPLPGESALIAASAAAARGEFPIRAVVARRLRRLGARRQHRLPDRPPARPRGAAAPRPPLRRHRGGDGEGRGDHRPLGPADGRRRPLRRGAAPAQRPRRRHHRHALAALPRRQPRRRRALGRRLDHARLPLRPRHRASCPTSGTT